MNKLLALIVSAAFLLVACGDDSHPSSPKDEEEISSSSFEDESSSSKKGGSKSSSSKANDKKSSDSKDSKSSSSVKDSGKSSSSAAKDEKSSSSIDTDEPNSSSVGEQSSSSSSENKPESSSSEDLSVSSSSKDEPESSSSVDSNGDRAATLEDLDPNMEMFIDGQKFYLSVGSRQGVLSLRIVDEVWVVTYSDFENGEVEFKEGSAGMQFIDTQVAREFIEKTKEGIKISFKVDKDGVVKYSINGSDYINVTAVKISLLSGKVSKAEKIMNKVYTCTDDDATKIFTFYDKSYVLENIAEGKTVSQESGFYDIQRSTLLLYNSSLSSLSTYLVNVDNTFVLLGGDEKTMNCTVSEITEY